MCLKEIMYPLVQIMLVLNKIFETENDFDRVKNNTWMIGNLLILFVNKNKLVLIELAINFY